jgi:filamentous hemagglutinin
MLARHRAAIGGAVAVCLALGVTGAWAQCPNLAQLCAAPAGSDPCVIDTNQTVPGDRPGCTYDLGGRGLVIKTGKKLEVGQGLGPLTITARTILLEPGAQIVADGLNEALIGGFIGLVATDTITLQNLDTKRAQISVAGPNGGVLALQAGNDIVMGGSLDAHATAADGIGGDINVTSAQGNLTISGGGIRADGGNDVDNGASGGTVTLEAHGSVTIDALIDDSDGDCGDACETDVTADTGDVTVTANGSIDVSGMGSVASGGDVQIMAAGAVQLSGPILGTATGTTGVDGEGGDGGGLFVSAGAGVTLASLVSLSGHSLDGDGGDVDVEAAGNILLAASGSLLVPTTGEGGGGTVLVKSSAGDTTINGPIDARGDEFGGSIEVDAAGAATITSALNADSRMPTTEGGGTGGTITIQACSISAPAGAIISSVGPGAAPDNATNLLVASGHMVLGCQLHAGNDPGDPHNVLEAPSIADMTFTGTIDAVPPPNQVENPALSCATTTTTTTTAVTSTTISGGTTTTLTTSPTTSAGATTTTSVVTTTTPGTPTTTQAPSDCTELPLVGFDALSCRLDMLRIGLGTLPVEMLGGKKIGRQLAASLERATSAMQVAQGGKKVTANLRRARKQLNIFMHALKRAQRKGMPPDVSARFQTLASEAMDELGSLRASAH